MASRRSQSFRICPLFHNLSFYESARQHQPAASRSSGFAFTPSSALVPPARVENYELVSEPPPGGG
jgi:hypothetical protein